MVFRPIYRFTFDHWNWSNAITVCTSYGSIYSWWNSQSALDLPNHVYMIYEIIIFCFDGDKDEDRQRWDNNALTMTRMMKRQQSLLLGGTMILGE